MEKVPVRVKKRGGMKLKNLQKITSIDFAILILNERRNKLSNVYAPLAVKINKTIADLEKFKQEKEVKK